MKANSTGILVFDIEALSFDYNATFLSVGMAYHDYDEWHSGSSINDIISKNIKLNIQEQIKDFNRSVDPSTVEWWKSDNVSKEARRILIPSDQDVSLRYLDSHIRQFASENKIDLQRVDVYNRMPFNALIKLSMLYESNFFGEGVKAPWNLFNQFDIGTMLTLLTGNQVGVKIEDIPENVVKHRSSDDAKLEVYRVLTALKENGVL